MQWSNKNVSSYTEHLVWPANQNLVSNFLPLSLFTLKYILKQNLLKIQVKETLWLASKFILEKSAQEIVIKLSNLPCIFNYINILT